MPRDLMKSFELNKNANEIAQLLKKFPAIQKAIKSNPTLTIIISDLIKEAASLTELSEKRFE